MQINEKTFFTIPDAPNYEVNALFQIRNKKSGFFRKQADQIELQTHGGHTVKRKISTFYRQARADALKCKENFVPLPSLNYRYEITISGILRNSFTKKIIKPNNIKYFYLHINSKTVVRSIEDLLFEAHGVEYVKRNHSVKVAVRNGGNWIHFPNLTTCAKFLSPRVFRSVERIAAIFVARPLQIFGWFVRYPED